ncbi:hypothetical protein [Nocardioides nematodiphilus]|uniref:hypothetical protein n=1 Tax=Nocardioides nematodiphilus TaxID=2849669 RepID=UPI001CDA2F5B|nr:hypothetical protein [Nocardioides nematodiphilus]MCA1981326.1 hypothetical protein [Nocardioides nematodiphilus]
MNKFTRVLGTTLAGAALVGGSAVAADAHGAHRDGFGGHHSAPASGPFSAAQAYHQFAGFSRHHGDGEGRFNLGPSFNHRWFHKHYGGHRHHAWSFADRQAAIVAKLTRADDRLTRLIGYLSDQAAADPQGWEAAVLPSLQAQQTRLETLIDAVKAATNDDELKAAFQAAFPKPTPPTTPTPSPAPTTAPTV